MFGVYKHYKGDYYLVLGTGKLSEDRDQEMVIYWSFKKNCCWIRPLKMFKEKVLINNEEISRFKKIIGI